jgi:hypothetical protein
VPVYGVTGTPTPCQASVEKEQGHAKKRAGGRRVKDQSGKCEGSEGLGGGLDRLKNRSEKCEGSRGEGRRGKELEWEMRRTEAARGGPTVV